MFDISRRPRTGAYRERFLYEKGGDLPPVVIDAEVADDLPEEGGENVIDVLGILASEGIGLDGDGEEAEIAETGQAGKVD